MTIEADCQMQEEEIEALKIERTKLLNIINEMRLKLIAHGNTIATLEWELGEKD